MRIVAGKWRGHGLAVPDTAETRPTMDRTRQAIFTILRSAAWALGASGEPLLNGANVLDVFAGSGAMGFEALSQGAAQATFFEKAPLAIQTIEKNTVKLKTPATVIKQDVTLLKQRATRPADMAFIDPPYGAGLMMPALAALSQTGWIDPETLLILEMPKIEQPDSTRLNILDARRYGLSQIVFARLKDI